MKGLIKDLAIDFVYSTEELESNGLDLLFLSNEENSDYYLFIFSNYREIEDKFGGIANLEYGLNELVYTLQKKKDLSDLKGNISLILALEVNSDSNLVPLYKAEENTLIAKKYILPYYNIELDELNRKLEESDTADFKLLNNLLMSATSIKENIENHHWYSLVTRLFIKIPFLNIEISKEESEKLQSFEKFRDQRITKTSLSTMILKDFDLEHIISNYDFNE